MKHSPIINIDLLPQDIRKNVNKYLIKLIGLLGNDIVSIFIYGSATGKNYIQGKSDVNIAVVLKELGIGELKKSLKVVSWGIKKRISAPLMMTVKHIQTSTDVFPVEFLEMKDSYYLLYGQDLLKDLPIEKTNLRLQCEQQLKGKLIRIRQAYLEIGLNKKSLNALLKESLNSLFPIFRGLLRLKTAQEPSTDKKEIIKNMARNFATDADVFLSVLLNQKNSEEIFEKYIREIENMAIMIDRM